MFKYRRIPENPSSVDANRNDEVQELGESGKEKELGERTCITLHFFRHGKKGKKEVGAPDEPVELTEQGRAEALATGREHPANTEVAWAAGSPRIRSAHTALLRLIGARQDIAEKIKDMSYADAKKEIKKMLKAGEKVATLPELNFVTDGTPEFSNAFEHAYETGHALEFMVLESDDLVAKQKDMASLSYSRIAANFASLIAREMVVGNNFNKLVSSNRDKYIEYNNALERYFGTHHTVPESFYLKALEKITGQRPTPEFMKTYFSDQTGKVNGFDTQEGFTIDIVNQGATQQLILRGSRGIPDITLTPKILAEIIGDAERLDANIENHE